MNYGFRIYVVPEEVEVDKEFTTDDIRDNAVDIIKAETLPQMLNHLIKGFNDGTLSDMNWYFLYDENEMVLLSDIPNGFVMKEVEEVEEPKEETEYEKKIREEARDFDYGMGEKHDNY